MEDARKAAWRAVATTVIKNLSRRNMEGYWCESSQDAIRLITQMIPAGDSIAWGGSETFKQTGMKAALESGTYRLLDRSAATCADEQRKLWRERADADWFFMSTNALTCNGELVNIDGNGDRLALLVHGPRHVIVLAGMNKIVADVDAGIKRVRTVACPANAARLHTNTPCEITGVCAACHTEQCMCCQEVITRHSRQTGRIKVVLIGEELGY